MHQIAVAQSVNDTDSLALRASEDEATKLQGELLALSKDAASQGDSARAKYTESAESAEKALMEVGSRLRE